MDRKTTNGALPKLRERGNGERVIESGYCVGVQETTRAPETMGARERGALFHLFFLRVFSSGNYFPINC